MHEHTGARVSLVCNFNTHVYIAGMSVDDSLRVHVCVFNLNERELTKQAQELTYTILAMTSHL